MSSAKPAGTPPQAARAGLQSALALLERGDWQAAHEIVQQDEASPLACWAHGIVHILEGDLANARYWYGEAKREFPDPVSAQAELRALRRALEGSTQ